MTNSHMWQRPQVLCIIIKIILLAIILAIAIQQNEQMYQLNPTYIAGHL